MGFLMFFVLWKIIPMTVFPACETRKIRQSAKVFPIFSAVGLLKELNRCVPFMGVCVHVRSVSFSALTLTNEVFFWFRFVNFSNVTPHMGAEPGRAKRKSRIACMRMLRTPHFLSQIGGKTIFGSTFPLGLVARFSELKYAQQNYSILIGREQYN